MARAELERLGGIRIAESVYAEWEAGSRQPSAANLARLETFYGTSPSQSGEPGDLASAIRELTTELRAAREERMSMRRRIAALEARLGLDSDADPELAAWGQAHSGSPSRPPVGHPAR